MQYRMISIDLDGTLVDGDGRVGDDNRRAIERALEAGLLVVPCTGRTWQESRAILDQLPPLELGVFATGTIVNQVQDGRPLNMVTLSPDLAYRAVQLLAELPEAVLVLREPYAAGHEYLVTGRGRITDHIGWWLEHTASPTREQRQVSPQDLTHTLRVGTVTSAQAAEDSAQRLEQAFGDQVVIEWIQTGDESKSLHLLSVFAAGVDKWRGLLWVADKHGMTPEQIVVIGDHVNDVTMVRLAGCGIAMDNAVPQVKNVAKYVTRANHDGGVAHAINHVLDGSWG